MLIRTASCAERGKERRIFSDTGVSNSAVARMGDLDDGPERRTTSGAPEKPWWVVTRCKCAEEREVPKWKVAWARIVRRLVR